MVKVFKKATSQSTIAQAREIALQSLRACYEQDGIIAGQHHFTDYWGRDGYFAALGSLAVGDNEIVQKMVRLFFRHQRKDGLIPYRLMRGPITLGKYLGKPKFFKFPRPTYRLRNFGTEVLDGTTLTLLMYALLGLKKWPEAKRYISQVEKALIYLESRERHGLLWDGVMAEWNDTMYKWGNLLYSNIIYWKMLERLAAYYRVINNPNWKILDQKQRAVAQALRAELWNGKFFADWRGFHRHDYYYPFGNCLAIAWGLTTPEETESILAKTKTVEIKFTLESNDPKYPWWRVHLLNHISGTGDYQNKGMLWWAPAPIYVEALITAGKLEEAKKQLQKMAEKIVEDGTIYECYERSGKPAKRLLYKTEEPFAWAAGLLVSAFEKFK
jgi:glycogen debranching enzyme